jgi:predicted nucleic acid-binding protein
MSAESVFLDTNILVYANDRAAGAKREVARRLIMETITSDTGCISAQVLSEFWVTVTRKLAVPLERAMAERQIALFSGFRIVPIDAGLVLRAVRIQEKHGISFWDAQMVAAAAHAGCGVLYSEDLQDGSVYESLRVVNPFRGSGG